MQRIEESKVSPDDIIEFGYYLRLIKKRLLSIILFSILISGLAVLTVLSLKPTFTATAILLIEAQQKKAVSIEEVVGIDASQKEYYLTQFEILKSNQIAEKVIKQLGLDQLEEFNHSLSEKQSFLTNIIHSFPVVAALLNANTDAQVSQESIRQNVLAAFRENLTIFPVRKTQLVKIKFTSQDPELAAKIANAVGFAYIDLNLEARLSTTKYATSWIGQRLVELKEQLASSEQAMSEFLVREQLIDDSGIDALASQELANLTKRLAEIRDRRIETEATYTALKATRITDVSSLSAIPSISSHPQVITIQEAEIHAVNEVERLSRRYGPKHDKMRAAQAKLDAVQQQAQQTTRKLINGIGKELQAVKKQEQLIQREIDQRKTEFQSITVKKSRFEALKREVETNRNILNVFLTREKETTATSDFEAANARFTDEALVPQEPSAPNKKLIVVGSFIASMLFAAIVVIAIDLVKNTVESVKGFEDKFGLVPLGSVPKVKAKRFKKQPLDRTVFFDEKEVGFNESIRSIRTSVMLAQMNGSKKRLAITSSLPSEGKTTLAVNLAMSFAKVGKTLLIDCDLRKSSVAERFGYKKHQQGLTNHLLMGTDLEDCLIVDEESGLTILPAGILTPNPQELLSSDMFEQLLTKLDGLFEKIVIDTPPTLPVSDSLILGQLAQQTLLVVKANATKEASISRTLSKLMTHKVAISGVVVNQVHAKVDRAEYGYGYDEYSHYSQANA